MRGVDERDVGLGLPEECVAWRRAQDYEVLVGDDMAGVDLDWWNTRLARHQIPVQLYGRDPDGAPTDHGAAYLRRADLYDTALPAHGPTDLVVLYRAAAWLTGHPHRPHARRFPDTRATTPPRAGRDGTRGGDLDVTLTALDQLRHTHLGRHDFGPYRGRSGWPRTPGVGPTVLSLYTWATHDTTTTANPATAAGRPQLLDPYSVATLIYLGWLEDPSVAHFTATRYRRYDALLHHWATTAQVPAELIEMWLNQHWRHRTHSSPPNR